MIPTTLWTAIVTLAIGFGAMMGGLSSMLMFIVAVTGVVQACLALRVM
jgi:hypothetical protein